MAQDSDITKPEDKGKSKAVDESKKEKPLVNGKKEDDKIDCMPTPMMTLGQNKGQYRVNFNQSTAPEELSEEDQQLKSELDMLVERLSVCLWPARGYGVESLF
jgi:26S proteasome regulatory subunit N1